jgi:hypothetical protein
MSRGRETEKKKKMGKRFLNIQSVDVTVFQHMLIPSYEGEVRLRMPQHSVEKHLAELSINLFSVLENLRMSFC